MRSRTPSASRTVCFTASIGRVVAVVGHEAELDGVIAHLDRLLHRVADRRRCRCWARWKPTAAALEVGVDANLVAHLAAEQLPHRHAERLALDVPQCACSMPDTAVRPIEPSGQKLKRVIVLHDMLDVHRVFADDERGKVVDGAGHGARLPLERGLAPAMQAPADRSAPSRRSSCGGLALTRTVSMPVIFMTAPEWRAAGRRRRVRRRGRRLTFFTNISWPLFRSISRPRPGASQQVDHRVLDDRAAAGR